MKQWKVYVKIASAADGLQVVVEAEDEARARHKAKLAVAERLITMTCTEIPFDVRIPDDPA